jgi:cell wall-associated NlpC family hydrolase
VDPRLVGAVDDTGQQNRHASNRTDDAIERTRKDSRGKNDIDKSGSDAVSGIGPALLSALGAGAQSALGGARGGMPSMPQVPASSAGQSTPASLSNPAAANAISKLLGDNASGRGGLGLGAKSGKAVVNGPLGAGGTEYQQRILALARQVVGAGIPYSWGSGDLNGPTCSGTSDAGAADAAGDYSKSGFDCSSLARYLIYQASGLEIPRTSEAQYASGMEVTGANAQPGDLLFPDHSFGSGGPGHVQVYVGEGKVVEAQQSGTNVMFSDAPSGRFVRYVSG